MMYPVTTSSSSSPSSSRWCPTPEQVMILEELYCTGIKTPSATQIQQITCHLSYHGKVEGKNVFYWFQNHKARERQKLRRKLTKQHGQRVQLQLLNSAGCQLIPRLERSSVALEQQAPFSTSSSVAGFPEQGGPVLEKYHMSKPVMYDNKWNMVYRNELSKVNQPWIRTHDRSWKATEMDNGCPTHPIPCCSNTASPLRTLQLFPVKSTNLRHESKDSNQFPSL